MSDHDRKPEDKEPEEKKTEGKKPDTGPGGGYHSLFREPAFRWAMGVTGIGWAMMGVAFYLAATQDKTPPAPEQPRTEQTAPRVPQEPQP
jgi:hypothetical protein